MVIKINNKPVVLKKGSTFEYVAENRLFSGADDYTMEISLPLKDCRQNVEIFGKIFRKDVKPYNIIFECEIMDKSFYKAGAACITEISESEVKIQFLEGRSAQNFDKTLADIYINELDLGAPKITNPANITPDSAMSVSAQTNYVCLPWVNGSIEDTIIHNEMVEEGGVVNNVANYHYVWGKDVKSLSWQPYLIYITKQILEAVGYSYQFSRWESDPSLRYLLVCNTVPDAWDINGFARALPHWTVEEFFAKLEQFMGAEFTFNHKTKSVSMNFSNLVDSSIKPVMIEKVVDEFSVEIDVEEDKCEYVEAQNIVYKEQNNEMWKFYSCGWYIDMMVNDEEFHLNTIVECSSIDDLIAKTQKYRSWNGTSGRSDQGAHNLYHVADVNMYYVLRYHEYNKVQMSAPARSFFNMQCFLQPVNSFGGYIVNDDADAEKNEIELEFVPVAIDYTDKQHKNVMFLYPSAYAEDKEFADVEDYWDDSYVPPINSVERIKSGSSNKEKPEYYDCIFLAYWDGSKKEFRNNSNYLASPHPFVESVNIGYIWDVAKFDFSLRLNNGEIARRYRGISLDIRRKHNFRFLADSLPSPRAIFFIKGKRYLCEKMTCTFSESGMSKMIKGVFWAID